MDRPDKLGNKIESLEGKSFTGLVHGLVSPGPLWRPGCPGKLVLSQPLYTTSGMGCTGPS
jgi:hypothetical protein